MFPFYEGALKRNLGKKEANLLIQFVEKQILKGHFLIQVPICGGRFRIDATCIKSKSFKFPFPITIYRRLKGLSRILSSLDKGTSVWVLEIKDKLNFEVLGQILVDMYYFPREYPNLKVEGYGIICDVSDKYMETVLKQYKVHVFEI